MFPEHDCQPRTKLAPAAENFLSCEDSLSSVLNAVPWLWSSPSLLPHPNYLALFIIQRLCWRQALRFPKENCFYTYKWKKKKKKRLDGCNVILSVMCRVEIQSTTSLPALHFCSIYFLFLFLFFFQFYFSSLGRDRMMRNTNPRKTNIVLKPHKRMSVMVVKMCLLLG